jgi:hypothetical protein
VAEERDKDNGRRNSVGGGPVVSGGVAYCGGLAWWGLCAIRGASLDNECLREFRVALALKLKENLGAMVMHLEHSGLATKRNFSR